MTINALDRVIEIIGPFTDESYVPGPHVKEFLENSKVLVIGAGGLGCEILKNLALSGFKDIHVIDMDTIDISNLNRQFLFRAADIGKPKATVAAEFVSKRVKGVKITPYFGKIQEKNEEYYSQFTLVVCGLDSVEARRWINALLVNMVDDENPESIKPLIDGGTEGFKGQARVIIPTISSCYECSLDMLGKQQTYPICTIANTPRLPEHCIEWASELEWVKVFPGKKLDKDNMENIQWLYEVALQRANEFKITGVTYSLTQGVIKNIIPSIASTNAVIAAACCNEALKIVTSVNPYLDNYMMYTGNEGVYTYTFQHQRKEKDCPVCGKGNGYLTVSIPKDITLEDFITEELMLRPDIKVKSPSLRTVRTVLYFQWPPQLKEATERNLSKKMIELVNEDEEIVITDPALPFSLRLRLFYE
ncbi:putative NEDD8 activating enzyme [Nadsonia fulvescens var. elongata DSM 6958]|uniref:NEDD8-activating enzyme E1 catalytic subunit n=1 Tax=Nadsonia fulvescens var. elongata DSM 6958 TaxID=857566 RepID=A0A1E3PR38_9ASCO|nr:putative NEDD8 activating enzyme [Nadsonia fulvescens var. elongata DSM 6958]